MSILAKASGGFFLFPVLNLKSYSALALMKGLFQESKALYSGKSVLLLHPARCGTFRCGACGRDSERLHSTKAGMGWKGKCSRAWREEGREQARDLTAHARSYPHFLALTAHFASSCIAGTHLKSLIATRL